MNTLLHLSIHTFSSGGPSLFPRMGLYEARFLHLALSFKQQLPWDAVRVSCHSLIRSSYGSVIFRSDKYYQFFIQSSIDRHLFPVSPPSCYKQCCNKHLCIYIPLTGAFISTERSPGVELLNRRLYVFFFISVDVARLLSKNAVIHHISPNNSRACDFFASTPAIGVRFF